MSDDPWTRLEKLRLICICLAFALAVATLFSCGPRPDYVSTRGATYYLQGRHWAHADIEAQESYFIEHIPSPWLSRQAAIAVGRSTVYLEPAAFGCAGTASPTGRCAEYELNGMLEIADLGCPFNSALTHGMAHVMQSGVGIYDPKHTDLELWRVADSAAGTCEL